MTSPHHSFARRVVERLELLGRHVAVGHAPPDPYWAHTYFTDGENLYRFVGWVARSIDMMLAEFEDCRSLNIVVVRIDGRTMSDLWPVAQIKTA